MGAKPLTKERRELILHARSLGKSVKEICVLYMAGKTAVYNLYSLYDKTGKKRKGRKGRIEVETLEKIRLRITEKNDITLQELIDEFELSLVGDFL